MGDEPSFSWDALELRAEMEREKALYTVSTVIACYNSSHLISSTLDSIARQDYKAKELIVIDAGSTDHTLEIVKRYPGLDARIYSVAEYRLYEMLNRGLSLAKGEYVNFLFPGDYYLAKDTLSHMVAFAEENARPSLLFCGSMLRILGKEPRPLFRSLDLPLLRQGKQPTAIQACWFHTETLSEFGRFRTDLSIRGGLDLFCRYFLEKKLSIRGTSRVLLDAPYHPIHQVNILLHFMDTLRVLWTHFGFWTCLRWIFIQKDLKRFFSIWWQNVKVAFVGH